METEAINITTIVTWIILGAVGIIAFFLKRTIDGMDKTISDHEKRIIDVERDLALNSERDRMMVDKLKSVLEAKLSELTNDIKDLKGELHRLSLKLDK